MDNTLKDINQLRTRELRITFLLLQPMRACIKVDLLLIGSKEAQQDMAEMVILRGKMLVHNKSNNSMMNNMDNMQSISSLTSPSSHSINQSNSLTSSNQRNNCLI
jgi:hypothetical protein